MKNNVCFIIDYCWNWGHFNNVVCCWKLLFCFMVLNDQELLTLNGLLNNMYLGINSPCWLAGFPVTCLMAVTPMPIRCLHGCSNDRSACPLFYLAATHVPFMAFSAFTFHVQPFLLPLCQHKSLVLSFYGRIAYSNIGCLLKIKVFF